LQEILLDPKFDKLQTDFLDKNCDEFDAESKENKLSYTRIFDEWTKLIETYIDKELQEKVNGYSSEKFMKMVKERPDEVTGDVFDMLMSLSDFEEFRGVILAYKKSKEGKGINLLLCKDSNAKN